MNQIFNPKVMNCDIIVAYAAHAIHRLNTNMNNGSNIILIIAPTIIDVMANFGFHSALIIEFNAIHIIKNGIHRAIIPQYVVA